MTCPKCNYENLSSASFCGKCGTKIIQPERMPYMVHIKRTGIFFSVLMVFIASLNIFELQEDYQSILTHDGIFIAIVLLFFFIGFKDIKPVLFSKSFDFKVLVLVIFSAIGFSVPVTYVADYINSQLFQQFDVSYYWFFINSPAPLLFAVISIAIVPAVFEELAFRGLIFNDLLKVTSGTSAVVISAILFSFIHFSLIALLWIFPIGLAFGWLRLKYNTLIYGIAGHFFYNLSIILIEKYSIL